MKITKKRIIIVSIILIIAAAAWYFWSSSQNKTVQVEKVETENVVVRESVSASGFLTSENSADLNFLSGGTISKINVKKGDQVVTGQILANLNTSSASQSAKAAKDARDIALRNRDLFIAQNGDNQEAVGGKDAYEIQLRTLSEQISQAEATYRSQLNGISELNIKAPFNGTVVDVLKKNGEPVSPTEPIIILADLNQIYFELDLDQEDFGNIRLDDPAEIELDSYPDKIFTGKVMELPTYINPNSADKQLKVKIQIDQTEGNPLLIGMAGDGTVITNQSSTEIQALPYDAVYTEDDGRNYVWILNNDTLNKKYVEIGIVGDAYTEVKDNLEGQTIVIPSDSKAEISEGNKGQIAKK